MFKYINMIPQKTSTKISKKIETDFEKSKKFKFILTFIGSLIYGVGGLTSIGINQFSVYITSYFYHNNVSINMQYGNLVAPIILFSNSLSSPLGGYFEKKFGFYKTLIFSNLLMELILFIFINQMNIFFSLILLILLGMVGGIGMRIPGKNLVSYYPKKAGILSSFMTSSFITTAIIINIIGEKIMNPEKYTLEKGEEFYPLNISKNYIKFYKYFLCINPLLLILSLLLIKKYDNKEDKLIDSQPKISKNKKIKEENYKKNIKAVIKNKRIWIIIGVVIMGPFVLGFSRNTFRVYGALVSMSGVVLMYSQLLMGFSSVFIFPIWGFINDKYNYKIIIKIIIIGCIFQALILSIFIKINIIYLIAVIIGSVFFSGFTTTTNLHILKVYGIAYSIEIGGIINIFASLANILSGILSFIISKYYHNGEELQYAYRYIYILGFFICCAGFLLAINESEDKFNYPCAINDIKEDEEYSYVNNSEINEKESNEIELENTTQTI